jgi:hypothetical protein
MTEIIRPLADCTHCHGKGFFDSSPGKSKECDCVTRQKILHYLTPEYANPKITLDPKFPLAHFDDLLKRDLIFIKNFPLMRFREKLKSYLAVTWFEPETRKSHLTVSAWDVVQAYMRSDHNVKIEDIRAVDLFILLLDNDPRNSSYSEYLMLVIKERQRMGKRTLIWSRQNPGSEAFINLYGEPLSQWLLSDEANFRKISPKSEEEEAKPSYVRRA